MTSSSDNQKILHQLAQAAGVNIEWQDYRGLQKTVAPDVLRAVLKSLGLPAESEQQCRDCLEQLKSTEEREIPSLTTGRTGVRLKLPPVLQKALSVNETVELRSFTGDTQNLILERDSDGCICLPGIAEPGYYTLETSTGIASLAIAPPRCTSVQDITGSPHNFGLSAQIYSLRSAGDGGIGNFSALQTFARSCARAGAQALAISPVHALFSADETRYSPYAPSSRLFLNVLYADPAAVLGKELFNNCVKELNLQTQLARLEQVDLIEWPEAAKTKFAILRCFWGQHGRDMMNATGALGKEFIAFCKEGGEALEKHALFETIHAQQIENGREHWHWRTWPDQLQNPTNTAVKQLATEQQEQVSFHKFLQWLAFKGLTDAHKGAQEAGLAIGLIADLAIGTDSGGSHAWSRQEDMLSNLSVGAPPDLINHQGQNWGLTTFSPRALKAHNYEPFLEMIRAALRCAGGLRMDHILGLRRLWLVPDGAAATDGAYLEFPQKDFLNLIALESWRHKAIVVGEDLGTVPEGFREEISSVGILGMQVLWFEQENGLYRDPSRWRSDTMATTTTHDLPTISGWWKGRDIEWNQHLHRLPEGKTAQEEFQQREREKRTMWDAFLHARVAEGEAPGVEATETVVNCALKFIAKSPSPLTIAPVEDILGISEQPNLPGTIDEHPNWRRRLPLPVDEILQSDLAKARLEILRGPTRTSEDR